MKKILWKIEELWNHYFEIQNVQTIDIQNHYEHGVSKYYSRFHCVDEFDFSLSEESVFSDDDGSYLGLQTLQVSMKSGKPIYLFDNHNEIIYPFVEVSILKGNHYDVVHIDAHRDDAEFFGKKPLKIELEETEVFIKQTRISDFFDAIAHVRHPVLDTGSRGKPIYLLDNIHRICDSRSFQNFKLPEKPFILSLDIDIFGPEGDFIDLETKIKIIAHTWGRAEVVCIATSPGFIDQEFAQEIIEIFTFFKK